MARGLMLLIIALANVPWWLYGGEKATTNAHMKDQTGVDLVWQIVSLITIDGRAYPLFAFLFGYGIWQLYSRQSAAGTPWREARRLLQRRHAWMIAFGAVHGLLLWMGDIVGAYGLVGLLVTWILLRRSDRVLRNVVWAIVGLGLALSALGLASAVVISSGLAGYPAQFATPTVPLAAGESNYLVFSWLNILGWLGNVALQLVGLLVPLSVVLGIMAARRGLLDRPADHRRTLARIAIAGIALGWAGGALAAAKFAGGLFVPEADPTTLPITALTGVAGGVGYAALFGLIAAAIGERRGPVTRALSAVGKRSLSCYFAQSVLFAPLFAAWGLGLGGMLSPRQAAGAAVLVWLATVAFAVLLDRAGKRGPAETLLRRLAYGKRELAAPSSV